ncbi:HAMP domain-containing protein [Billgrantia tianxiuensis]|jgi:two-component system heavy metal sensor histidine kinase CusS|uniref:Sensor protein n=1 Tax=Billgrantia tianxiuensis TaxID=2497861 RepID=A0A6I6SLK7_9GAMM|nr:MULTISPECIES: heavy metal sensor histidine kinase [Halomonas]MCE8032594.1 heavy metal sensor histidine kinase [Halomonas sp. MCCC 1A11057]QHC49476.1 HAMP domain-containing protein [Halomonas tianxiuensis]
MTFYPHSLTARLATLFSLLVAGLLLLLGLSLEHLIRGHFDDIDQMELTAKLSMIENLLARADSPTALDTLPRYLDDVLTSHANLSVSIRDEAGRILYAHQPEFLAPIKNGDVSSPSARWSVASYEFIGREVQQHLPLPAPAPVQVLLGLDITHHAHFLEDIRRYLWTGIAMAALLTALLGWLVARQGLAPLKRITETARRLSAERLGERLDLQATPPEMLELANAFNGMLNRLEADFQRLSDFSADIAHELRTPVSNLLTETQVALSRPRNSEEYQDTLHSNLEELERLARMIADMLFLAKADHGLLPNPAESVHLEQEVAALLEFYDALAEEKQVTMQATGSATVIGDHLMLRRAVANLLSNALRHTPAGGNIVVEIEPHADEARLSVRNTGDPIPPDQLARLFERFHRVDNVRSHHGEGAGLGLAITRSILKAHGGEIVVSSSNGVTTFSLTLPRSNTQVQPG